MANKVKLHIWHSSTSTKQQQQLRIPTTYSTSTSPLIIGSFCGRFNIYNLAAMRLSTIFVYDKINREIDWNNRKWSSIVPCMCMMIKQFIHTWRPPLFTISSVHAGEMALLPPRVCKYVVVQLCKLRTLPMHTQFHFLSLCFLLFIPPANTNKNSIHSCGGAYHRRSIDRVNR